METGARPSLRSEQYYFCWLLQSAPLFSSMDLKDSFFFPLEKEKSQWVTAGTLGGTGFI